MRPEQGAERLVPVGSEILLIAHSSLPPPSGPGPRAWRGGRETHRNGPCPPARRASRRFPRAHTPRRRAARGPSVGAPAAWRGPGRAPPAGATGRCRAPDSAPGRRRWRAPRRSGGAPGAAGGRRPHSPRSSGTRARTASWGRIGRGPARPKRGRPAPRRPRHAGRSRAARATRRARSAWRSTSAPKASLSPRTGVCCQLGIGHGRGTHDPGKALSRGRRARPSRLDPAAKGLGRGPDGQPGAEGGDDHGHGARKDHEEEADERRARPRPARTPSAGPRWPGSRTARPVRRRRSRNRRDVAWRRDAGRLRPSAPGNSRLPRRGAAHSTSALQAVSRRNCASSRAPRAGSWSRTSSS